jgi:hypothetical protein
MGCKMEGHRASDCARLRAVEVGMRGRRGEMVKLQKAVIAGSDFLKWS